jgi:uncharacterized membrane protein
MKLLFATKTTSFSGRVMMAKDQERLIALDWMRGWVMVLMALDHASMIYNSGRLALDSAVTYAPGMPLPWAQFLTRWVTHLCAPTFVFLAGAALALSCHHRSASGHSERSIDRDIVIRGLIIASYDLVLTPFFTMHRPVLQVMFAIGMSMIAMAWLRRLNAVILLSAAVLWFLVGEAVTTFWWDPASGNPPMWAAFTIAVFRNNVLTILYPAIPWLSVMMLGWAFGRYLVSVPMESGHSPVRFLSGSGAVLLAVFFIVRAWNGYGNMLLLREDTTWIQWLHVSKYPPSLSFITLELGLMCLFLAAFMALEKRVKPQQKNLFLVFGQTALFFYFIHIPVLAVPAAIFDLSRAGSLAWAYGAAVIGLGVLYPICQKYRDYKFASPRSLMRYV